MKRCSTEIYNAIAAAGLGESVSTRHNNGMNYEFVIIDALAQQGYKRGVDFDTMFNASQCQTYIIKMATIKPYTAPKHNIKTGDIFYNMWGYEQTNIDYYQVTATTAKTITLKQIKAAATDYDAYQMTGNSVPVLNAFYNKDPQRKTPYLIGGNWCVRFEFGAGGQWDGEPMAYSSYA